jgi:ATP-dependent 26S proteasome regulatory subunit
MNAQQSSRMQFMLTCALYSRIRRNCALSVFMDEVDGLCSARGGGGEHEASRRVKGEILAQMDGAGTGEYDPARSVIVLGATNLPWELDTAFLRRFEKRVHIDLPDVEGRLQMFRLNTEGMAVAEDARQGNEWKDVVELSEGYSRADISVSYSPHTCACYEVSSFTPSSIDMHGHTINYTCQLLSLAPRDRAHAMRV